MNHKRKSIEIVNFIDNRLIKKPQSYSICCKLCIFSVGKLQLNKILKAYHMVAVQIFTQNNNNQLSHLLNYTIKSKHTYI